MKLNIPLGTRPGGGADAGADDAADVVTVFGGTLPDSYASVLLASTLANFSSITCSMLTSFCSESFFGLGSLDMSLETLSDAS